MFEDDAVAIVTGGTKGIGRSVTLQLAEHGVSVVATFHSDEDAAAELRDELDAFDQRTGVKQFDVGDYEAVEQAVDEIAEEYGTPSILINNAGIMINNISVRMSPSEWNDVVRTNLSGAFYCSKEVLRLMFRNNGGAIVNVSSIGALRGWAGQVNYASSKAGLIGMTQSFAREFGGKDIRVNAVCPGYTETELLEDAGDIVEDENIPQNRIGDPEEVANAIVFLASEKASYVNGATLRVDGGLLA